MSRGSQWGNRLKLQIQVVFITAHLRLSSTMDYVAAAYGFTDAALGAALH